MSDILVGNSLRLKDGRRLGYAQYGDPGGWPLMFFHGIPGSRIMARMAATRAAELGVHLIAPERPGYGLSEAQPGRRLLDWPEDVASLSDALEVDRFGVVGISGGGPYAAACAWALPARVEVVGLVSSLAPVAGVWQQLPWPRRLLARVVRQTSLTGPAAALLAAVTKRRPEWLIKSLGHAVSSDDKKILARPEVRRLQIDGLGEALQKGGAGMAFEMAILSRPWGFALKEIKVPVFLWHGERDEIVPLLMGRYLGGHIPRCRPRFIAGAGHLWIFDGFGEVLRILRNQAQTEKRPRTGC